METAHCTPLRNVRGNARRAEPAATAAPQALISMGGVTVRESVIEGGVARAPVCPPRRMVRRPRCVLFMSPRTRGDQESARRHAGRAGWWKVRGEGLGVVL